MRTLEELFKNNRDWADKIRRQDPEFFAKLSKQQSPTYLWIGCADSRVPANQIVGLLPGEVFVHRNIANQVVATDNNLQAVIQYAVEVLRVSSIVVCGHDDCGGVKAALGPTAPPHVEHWIAHVRNVARLHAGELSTHDEQAARCRRLVELNVTEQVYNLSRLPSVQAAHAAGRSLELHGWVYGVHDGLLRDLALTERLRKTAC